jgi:hypothetical protein
VQWDYAFDLTSADHQRQLYALAELLSDDAAIAALGVKPGKLGIASAAINPQLDGSSTGSLAHTASPTTAASSKPFGIQARRCRRVGGSLCSRFLPPGTRRYCFPLLFFARPPFLSRGPPPVSQTITCFCDPRCPFWRALPLSSSFRTTSRAVALPRAVAVRERLALRQRDEDVARGADPRHRRQPDPRDFVARRRGRPRGAELPLVLAELVDKRRAARPGWLVRRRGLLSLDLC